MDTKKKNTQSCSAWLHFGLGSVDGSTGKDHGHAEMDALHKYVASFDTVANAVQHFNQLRRQVPAPIGVYCPSRPVCKQCTAVLRPLGFIPISNASGSTVWGTDCMGSTEWGCSLKVREFLKQVGIDYQAVVNLRG
jgi:hypothetical protein